MHELCVIFDNFHKTGKSGRGKLRRGRISIKASGIFFTSVKKLAVTLCLVSETGRNLIYVQRHCEGAFLDHLKTFIKVFSFFKEKKERIINDDINTP